MILLRAVLAGVALVVMHLSPSVQSGPSLPDVLRHASLLAGRSGTGAALIWLRHQPGVGAVLGRDGRTINITSTAGTRAAILPAGRRTTSSSPLPGRLTFDAPGPRRALVLEPFATQLGLGPHAGDLDVDALRRAGFAVDQAYDSTVTLAMMAHLHDYAVVDIDTHSGANQYGEGVLATGQLYTDDPAIQPLMKEFSVMPVSISGSDQLYYGILSRYFRDHESDFPPRALLVLNGCDLLTAHIFWDALAARGAAAMVSWDGVVLPRDAQIGAELLLADMGSGMSLDQAMTAVRSGGYGISRRDGAVIRFGYLGDGSLTLSQAGNAPPPPTPTVTVVPTATTAPTVTPTPVPTVTPRPTTTPLPTATPTPVLADRGGCRRPEARCEGPSP